MRKPNFKILPLILVMNSEYVMAGGTANIIDDAVIASIASLVTFQTSLKNLNIGLSNANLSSANVVALSNAIGTLSTLKEVGMDLSGNSGVDDAAITALSSQLKTTLDKVDIGLSSTGVGDVGVSSLAAKISTMPALKSVDIDLSSTSVSNIGVSALGNALPSSVEDVKVGLVATSADDAGLGAIATKMQSLPKVTAINLTVPADSSVANDANALKQIFSSSSPLGQNIATGETISTLISELKTSGLTLSQISKILPLLDTSLPQTTAQKKATVLALSPAYEALTGWAGNSWINSLSLPADKQAAVLYFGDSANGATRRAGYIDAKTEGVITDAMTWSAVQNIMPFYAWANRSALLSKLSGPADKQAAVLYFADSTNGGARRSMYDANASTLLAGYTAFADIQNMIFAYNNLNTWTGRDPLLARFASPADKQAAVTYFNDAANGVSRRNAYDANASTLLAGYTVFANIQNMISAYNNLNTWTGRDLLLARFASPADKQTAVLYFGDNANGMTRRGMYDAIIADTANNGPRLFERLSSWSDISSAITWWQTAGNPGKFGAIMTDTANNGPRLFERLSTWSDISSAITWWQTAGNPGKFGAIMTDTANNGPRLFERLSTWSNINSAITWWQTAGNPGKFGAIMADAANNGPRLFERLSTWSDISSAITWWQTAGNPGKFGAIMTDTANNGPRLFERLSTWSNINSAITWWQTAGNPGKFGAIMADAANNGPRLFERLSTWSNINSAITWWQTAGNPAKFGAIMADAANNGPRLFDRLSTWSDISSAITWWQTAGNPAKFGAIMADAANNGPRPFERLSTWSNISSAITWWQTTGNPGKFGAIMADAANNGPRLFDRLSTWSDISSAITWWQTAGNPAKFSAIMTDNNMSGVISTFTAWSSFETFINKYSNLNSWANKNFLLSLLISSVERQNAVTYFGDDANGASRRNDYDNLKALNLLEGINYLAGIQDIIASYINLAGWSNKDTIIGLPSSEKEKQAVILYFGDSTNGVNRRAGYDGLKASGLVLNGGISAKELISKCLFGAVFPDGYAQGDLSAGITAQNLTALKTLYSWIYTDTAFYENTTVQSFIDHLIWGPTSLPKVGITNKNYHYDYYSFSNRIQSSIVEYTLPITTQRLDSLLSFANSNNLMISPTGQVLDGHDQALVLRTLNAFVKNDETLDVTLFNFIKSWASDPVHNFSFSDWWCYRPTAGSPDGSTPGFFNYIADSNPDSNFMSLISSMYYLKKYLVDNNIAQGSEDAALLQRYMATKDLGVNSTGLDIALRMAGIGYVKF